MPEFLEIILLTSAIAIFFGLSTAAARKIGEQEGYDKGFIAGAKCQVQEVSPGVFEITYVDASKASVPKKRKHKRNQRGGG